MASNNKKKPDKRPARVNYNSAGRQAINRSKRQARHAKQVAKKAARLARRVIEQGKPLPKGCKLVLKSGAINGACKEAATCGLL